jgi:hypothetical protein
MIWGGFTQVATVHPSSTLLVLDVLLGWPGRSPFVHNRPSRTTGDRDLALTPLRWPRRFAPSAPCTQDVVQRAAFSHWLACAGGVLHSSLWYMHIRYCYLLFVLFTTSVCLWFTHRNRFMLCLLLLAPQQPVYFMHGRPLL